MLMSKVRLKFAVREMFGTLYEVDVRLSHRDEEVVDATNIKRPTMPTEKSSEAQKAHRQRFKEAVAYAKVALAEPKVYLQYQEQAKRQNRSAWAVAVADYFHGKNMLSGD